MRKNSNLKAWKNYPYKKSVDREASKILADLLNIDENGIIVWHYWPREKKFYFQYNSKYYKYENNKQEEIDGDVIFNEKNQD